MKTILATISTLMLSGAAYGQTIRQIEYFLDTDAGFGKNKLVSVTPSADGPFSFTADVSGATVGFHALYIRTRDSNNQWSHTTRRTVEVLKNPGGTSTIARIEYFFDTDPGFSKAASITLATPQSDGTFSFIIPVNQTTPGTHTLYVRAKDSPEQDWSLTQWKAVTIVNCTPPAQPPAVASQTICSGSPVTFTVQDVAQATGYRWSVPTNWTVVSGQGTNSVVLKAPTVTAVTTFTGLSVAASNSCDAGPVRTFSATVNALPATPTITATATLLTASSVSGNQWFLNGTLLSGATGQTYQPLAAGAYTVQTTANGCSSFQSASYTFIVTAVDDPGMPDVQVFPNPVTSFFSVINSSRHPVQIQLYSMRGQLVLTAEQIMGNQRVAIDQLATGYYILKIKQDGRMRSQLLLKL